MKQPVRLVAYRGLRQAPQFVELGHAPHVGHPEVRAFLARAKLARANVMVHGMNAAHWEAVFKAQCEAANEERMAA